MRSSLGRSLRGALGGAQCAQIVPGKSAFTGRAAEGAIGYLVAPTAAIRARTAASLRAGNYLLPSLRTPSVTRYVPSFLPLVLEPRGLCREPGRPWVLSRTGTGTTGWREPEGALRFLYMVFRLVLFGESR